jgi:phosphoserine phosphatase
VAHVSTDKRRETLIDRPTSWSLRCGGAAEAGVISSSLETVLGFYGVEIAHFSRPPGGRSRGRSPLEFRLAAAEGVPATRAQLAWRRPLFEWARSLELDLLLLPSSAARPPPLLCAFDGDGTLFAGETIDEIARLAGVGEAVATVTAAAMRGELDFENALRERVRRLRGLPLARLGEIDERLPLMPGAQLCLATLKERGSSLALFTGGFRFFAAARAAELGIEHMLANQLADDGRALTGELEGVIVDAAAKEAGLRSLCLQLDIPLARSLACGDGANDLPMLDAAGTAIGFLPKDVLLDRLDGALFRGDWSALDPLLPQPPCA